MAAADVRYRRRRVLSTRLCLCGCGLYTFLAVKTDLRKGHVRGQPLLYRRGHSTRGTTFAASPGEP